MKREIPKDWQKVLKEEFAKPYFDKLSRFIDHEYAHGEIFPTRENLFNALIKCPFNDVKVVIIGQDPYHDVGQAHGLCFSVRDGIKLPPSLVNIFKELHSELGIAPSMSGNLESWASQGVLMLNSVLTVEPHKAASHSKMGWEEFTDAIVRAVATHHSQVVYILWGKAAQTKCSMVDNSTNLVLESVHPSPLSAYRGFFGCGHFAKTNDYLVECGKQPIKWQLPAKATLSLFDFDAQDSDK